MSKLIAEACCNHKGDFGIAKEMIDIAVQCNCDIIKFQKRNNRELLSPAQYNAPHPVPENSYGTTYGAHREALEFTLEQHEELKDYCDSKGICYSCSVWDLTSAKEIASLRSEFIKIPSAQNTNFALLDWLCTKYDGQIHLSLGMTSHDEEERIVKFFEERGRHGDLTLYACTSGYPVDFEDVCLLEITRLQNKFATRVKSIGFSGHHLGIAVDIAAATLGADWIERHFTLNRAWKGTDHAASLEPRGMANLARDLKALSKALRFKSCEILPVEEIQRKKLKYKKVDT